MVVYIDWNILTNILDTNKLSSPLQLQNFNKLKEYIDNNKENLFIPYSNAHLSDLKKGYKNDENDWIFEKLKNLSIISNDLCITQYWNKENAIFHKRNPEEFFNSLINDDEGIFNSWEELMVPLKKYGLDSVFNLYKDIPHNMNFEEIDKQFPFFKTIFKNSRQENTMYAGIQDTFDLFCQIQENPTVYKELRKIFKDGLNIDPNISNFDNTIEQLDEYLPKTMLNKSFNELYNENANNKMKNEDYDRIIGVYMQLDFVGYNSDKLSSKNEYNNIFNDALHCFYGAHCDYYLTNDNRNYKKSKAVYESEDISTQVLKLDEFLKIIN